MSDNEPCFRLTIRPLKAGVPAVVRLRLLKLLLRCFAFRCVGVEELPAPEGPAPAGEGWP